MTHLPQIRIAHIVNPVAVPPESRFHFVQQVTFETMRRARDYAQGQVDVTLLTTQYPEEHPVLPEGFRATPDLTRSVLDLGQFRRERKLPLIGDILRRAYEHSGADYLLYTNADIGLLPHFYVTVAHLIAEGYDGLVINRRSIPDTFNSLDALPQMYAEVGAPHRGWDCFVFRRDLFPKFTLGETCVGAPRVELALYANLLLWSRRFREFKDLHLTFHLGNDAHWRDSTYADYADYNTRQSLRALRALEETAGPFPPASPPARFLRTRRSRLRIYLYDLLIKQIYIPLEIVQCGQKLLHWLKFW